MAIAMTTGYSAQTEGALLCINAASDWALTCVDQLPAQTSYVLIDYGAADGGTAVGPVSYTHLTLPTICSV